MKFDFIAGFLFCTRHFTSYQECRFLLHSARSFIQTGLYKGVIAGKKEESVLNEVVRYISSEIDNRLRKLPKKKPLQKKHYHSFNIFCKSYSLQLVVSHGVKKVFFSVLNEIGFVHLQCRVAAWLLVRFVYYTARVISFAKLKPSKVQSLFRIFFH